MILAAAERLSTGAAAAELAWPDQLVLATRRVLLDPNLDFAYKAEVLTLPVESTLAEQMAVVDPESLYLARCSLLQFLSAGLAADLAELCLLYTSPSPRD